MRRLFPAILAATLAVPAPVAAQSATQCVPRAKALHALASRFGESRQSVGLAAKGRVVVETFANLDSGSWTITRTDLSGLTCMIAAGQGFERLDEALPPMGDDS